jgi:hypothetical protein
MGYCMWQDDCDFVIKAANFPAALQAIKDLMVNKEEMDGGSWSGGVMVERWYSWVHTDAVMESETLIDALSAWRWDAEERENGDIYFISFTGEKSGQDEILFRAIAPYVKNGSYICMRGEDGALWRWYFDGGVCKEQEGRVIYE